MKSDKKTRLFMILGGFFITNAIVAEFIGAKIFSLELSLGLRPFDISVLGFDHLSLEMTCGVLLWPVVFVMTDIINEYYGKEGVRMLSFLAAGLIAYAFVMVFIAMRSVPASWWIASGMSKGVSDMQSAYTAVFGQGLWIIAGSLCAFLVGQLVDVHVFHLIRTRSGNRFLWLRSTGSTLVSQLIDSFVVLFIAFYIGNDWTIKQVLAIGLMNYLYKFAVAVLITPLLYLLHRIIDNYLGKDAEKMIRQADKQYE